MTLSPWEIASVRVTGLSRDTFTMGNIHGYVKKSKETAHDIKLSKKLGFSIPKQNNHEVSSKGNLCKGSAAVELQSRQLSTAVARRI